jgi:hypothetical protein
MKKSMLVCLLCMMISAWAYAQNAQNYTFRVLINKGKNEIKTGNNWMPAKVGASIGTTDEIRVPENAYLGLVHVSGKSLEIKDAGVHKVTDLSAKVGQGTSVLNKYTDFILSNNEQRKNNLTATGAVHRGVNSIKLFLPKPEAAIVYNNRIIFSWEKSDAPAPYTVIFRSMFGDELKKVDVPSNSVTIDLGDIAFENEDNIVVQVISKTDKNKQSDPDDYTIKRLSKADRERMKNTLNEVKDIMNEQTAINLFFMAGVYEKNNLLIDASTAYEEAIKLAPDVPEIQEAYRAFLIVHGMKELPKK